MAIAPPRLVQEFASLHANWLIPYQYKAEENAYLYKPAHCPRPIAEHFAARQKYKLPILSGVVEVPTLRHDGSLIIIPGYDPETGLYYAPERTYPPIIERPTRDDALEALRALDDVFVDFPFAATCHKSAAISALLTIVTRHLMRKVPMFSFTSTTPGSGKGLGAEVISIIATGQVPAFCTYSKDNEEMRKTLIAIAIEGDAITCFDNVDGMIGDPALDQAITAEIIKGESLASLKTPPSPFAPRFFAPAITCATGAT